MTDKITIDRAVVEQVLTAYANADHWEDLKAPMQALRAALDQPALAQQPAVPTGYKLVPVEPTEGMVDAVNDVIKANYNPANKAQKYQAKHAIAAMINAAPEAKPAVPPGSDDDIQLCDGTRGPMCCHQDPNDCDLKRDCPAHINAAPEAPAAQKEQP